MHDLLTTADAAKRLGVNRSTISRWVATGKLTPSVRLRHGAMLFAADVLDGLRCTTCGHVRLDDSDAA
jgi:excisionase family DNA binding protein